MIPRFPRSIYAIKTCSSCVAYFLPSVAFSQFCPPSAPRHVIDPAHIGQLGTQRLGMSRVSGHFLGVATPGQARTRASSPQKPKIALLSFCGRSLVGAMPAAGNLLETLGNLAETTLSPKASVSAAICCALLHSEPTISEIRAVFVACRTPVSVRTALRTFSLGFPRVITCPCSLHFFALALRSISA